jgi:hypothetical protein
MAYCIYAAQKGTMCVCVCVFRQSWQRGRVTLKVRGSRTQDWRHSVKRWRANSRASRVCCLPLLGRRLQRQRQPRLASAANGSKSLQGARRWPRGPEIWKATVIRASNCSVMVWGRWNCARVVSYPIACPSPGCRWASRVVDAADCSFPWVLPSKLRRALALYSSCRLLMAFVVSSNQAASCRKSCSCSSYAVQDARLL